MSTVKALDGCRVLLYTASGDLFGTKQGQLVRVSGLATPLREAASEFAQEVLLPCLAGVLPKGVLEIIAAYTLSW